MVETSGGKKHKRKRSRQGKRTNKRLHSSSILLDDTQIVSHGVPVCQIPKTLKLSFHHSIDTTSSNPSSSSASESNVKGDVIKVVEERGFVSIKRDWEYWRNRNDLFDYVVMKSVEFIAGFIKKVEYARKHTLAALFAKRLDIVEEVLKKIEYDGYDLFDLTTYRPELAESHENFFKAINKIRHPIYQESAVEKGVIDLFIAKKHDSVLSLIHALENTQFESKNLKSIAIQRAFYDGAYRGIKNIVEELHEHTAITSGRYANGLIESWRNDRLKTFPFLLAQADQGDLEQVKKDYKYKNDPEFRKVIDEAFSGAGLAGARHSRPKERIKPTMETFGEILDLQSLSREKEVGGIIGSYLVGESEGTHMEIEEGH
jgi:hypothetical protein